MTKEKRKTHAAITRRRISITPTEGCAGKHKRCPKFCLAIPKCNAFLCTIRSMSKYLDSRHDLRECSDSRRGIRQYPYSMSGI